MGKGRNFDRVRREEQLKRPATPRTRAEDYADGFLAGAEAGTREGKRIGYERGYVDGHRDGRAGRGPAKGRMPQFISPETYVRLKRNVESLADGRRGDD